MYEIRTKISGKNYVLRFYYLTELKTFCGYYKLKVMVLNMCNG